MSASGSFCLSPDQASLLRGHEGREPGPTTTTTSAPMTAPRAAKRAPQEVHPTSHMALLQEKEEDVVGFANFANFDALVDENNKLLVGGDCEENKKESPIVNESSAHTLENGSQHQNKNGNTKSEQDNEEEGDNDGWSVRAVKDGQPGTSSWMSQQDAPLQCYTRTYCFHPHEHRQGTCPCGNPKHVRSSAVEEQALQAHCTYTRHVVEAALMSKSKRRFFPSFHHPVATVETPSMQSTQGLAETFTNKLQILYKNLLFDKHECMRDNFQLMLTNATTDPSLLKLLSQQALWDSQNHGNTNIDVGIHYTKEANMKTIRRHGLLNRSERLGKQIWSQEHGRTSGVGTFPFHSIRIPFTKRLIV